MKQNIVRILAALVAMSAAASAGAKWTYTISAVDLGGGYKIVWGSMGSARNSADSIQYLSCEVSTNVSGNYSNVYCYAREASGVYTSCFSSNDKAIATVGTITDSSYINFTVDPNGNCTGITVRAASYLAPSQL
jgi:hypothetical protein